MKKLILVSAVFILLFSACKESSTKDESATATDSVAGEEGPSKSLITFCVWNELGVRETPDEKGKYLTSIYLGEKLTLVGDTASEKSGTKRNHYHKVQLSDGKQGWVRDEFIAIDAIPAAFITVTNLCKRPDLATVTDKNFKYMDFVAARPASDSWVEVTGKRSGDKWFSTGYVKSEALTFKPLEVEFAVLNRRAEEADNQKLKETLYGQLSNESVFGQSDFYYYMFAAEEVVEEELEDGGPAGSDGVSTGSNIIIRSSNYPTHYIAQQYMLGEMVELNQSPDSLEATFRLVTGLNQKCRDCVALESVQYPGYYFAPTGSLGSEGYRMQLFQLDAVDGSVRQQWLNSMSFRQFSGLARNPNEQGISYAAQYFGGFFIRHSSLHLWLQQNDGSDLFAKDATFIEVDR